jgi:hypothetical protein
MSRAEWERVSRGYITSCVLKRGKAKITQEAACIQQYICTDLKKNISDTGRDVEDVLGSDSEISGEKS